jgi:beta-galactosidase
MKPISSFFRRLCSSFLAASLFAAMNSHAAAPKHTFEIGTNDFLLDGQRFQIRCGEIHAPRVPKEYWRHRLQMAKAMGLNTVCAYLFWNMHEPEPGKFNWSGQADAAEFCRIAQQEGLWVILRPGPYSCAEWEMGGLPWWLLKDDDVKLRSRDPRSLEPAKKFFKEVGRVLGPLQITRGGPIIMAQIENEYGFYGNDAQYIEELRQALVNGGFNVPMFQCNPPAQMRNGMLTNLFQAGNFGSDVVRNLASVRRIQKTGPLMCAEFYPGWFDTWGAPHHYGNEQKYLSDLEAMLKAGASFSIYMAHGGTTFGLWSGADRPFKPDTSSYDYDAPISEAGWPTEKFFKTRELFQKYLLPGETIPEPPAKKQIISFPTVEVRECAPIFKNLLKPIADEKPHSIEYYNQGYGLILYRTKIPDSSSERTLQANEIHDFGYVYLNKDRVDIMDRRNRNFKAHIPVYSGEGTLDVLVEPMGRVNFGAEVHDRKGLFGPVKLDEKELTDWEIFNLRLDENMLRHLKYKDGISDVPISSALPNPAFWRVNVKLDKVGDTFLDLRAWNKGIVWVNGHCLGRYWNIGPTQTAYVPGCWLKRGKNEFVILDLVGPEKPVIAGLEKPILDELHPEKDFAKARRPVVKLNLDSAQPVHTGSFASGVALQEIKFSQPAKGRFFCIESLNAFDGKQFAAIAELDLLDDSGKPLSHEGWTVAYVDSEEREREDGTAENAIDGQTANFWHTQWGSAQPNHPHRLVLDLSKAQTISGFRYTPRQGDANAGGRIKDYRIYMGDSLVQK